MKTFSFLSWSGGLVSALLAGCTGITPGAQTQNRIREKPEVFNTLKVEQQNDVLGGAIERGNSMDTVYLALGKPNKIVTSADGMKAMWVYYEYYATGGPATTSFNSPNAAEYIPLYTSSAAPGPEDLGPRMDGPTPGHTDGLPGYLKSANFGSTRGPNLSQSLLMPELKQKTVYVFFVAQRVAEIKLDGDASDQRTAAANVTPPKKT